MTRDRCGRGALVRRPRPTRLIGRRVETAAALLAVFLAGCGAPSASGDPASASEVKAEVDDTMRGLLPEVLEVLDASATRGYGDFGTCTFDPEYSARVDVVGGSFGREPGAGRDTSEVRDLLVDSGFELEEAASPADTAASRGTISVFVAGPAARPPGDTPLTGGLRTMSVSSGCFDSSSDDEEYIDDTAPEDYGDVIPRGRLYEPRPEDG